MDEILLIDKPKGITSFDVIRILRHKLGIKKMGHAGTLDPLATGLMIIGLNEGTKKLNQYLKLSKTYEAVVRLGLQTTTGDLEGEVVAEKYIEYIDSSEIQKILQSMKGLLSLPVPLYSAIKVSGKPLYAYAREGKDVQVPYKDMNIEHIRLQRVHCYDGVCDLHLVLDVSSGTYIRSIAEEIGRRLNIPGTLASLRRIRIGMYTIDQARLLDRV